MNSNCEASGSLKIGKSVGEHLAARHFVQIELADGELWIQDEFFDYQTGIKYFEEFVLKTNWKQPKIRMGSRVIKSPRLSAWHGDPGAVYTYSGLENKPQKWTPTLNEIRDKLEAATGICFNSVLMNLYRDGKDSMGWHRDNEPELGTNPVIASISLGASRKFSMRHVRDKSLKWEYMLGHGSALIMSGATQQNWKHCVPKKPSLALMRINLTFRKIYCQT